MELNASNGCRFTLTIERYEFPDEELGPTEDNPESDFDSGRFLVVSHAFGNSDGRWQGEFPTMDTVEFIRLIDWLDSIRRNDISTQGAYFTERCLEFTIDDTQTSLRVHLCDELLPPWSANNSVVLDFPLSEIDLPAAIASLRQQAITFPGRPPLPSA